MTDEHDQDSARAYDHLRRQVDRSTDVDVALDQLHGRVGRGRHWRATVTAAAVVALFAVGALVIAGIDDGDTVSSTGSDPSPTAPTTSSTVDPRCGGPFTLVFLHPAATQAQAQAVRDELTGLGIESYEFIDAAATYQEFLRLFADQPDFIDAIDPADLPESFRIDGEITTTDVAALETLPGVLRVESSVGCPDPEVDMDTTATTALDEGG